MEKQYGELIHSLKEHVKLSQQQAVLTVNTRMLFLYWEIGIFINQQKEEFSTKFGPIFTQLVLADEINRTPPKTQAALLEAMQEKVVTVAGQTMSLGHPFFVLATQNPIEQEGTYPLPEAQLDRFMFNIWVDYPTFEEEIAIVKNTTNDSSSSLNSIFVE